MLAGREYCQARNSCRNRIELPVKGATEQSFWHPEPLLYEGRLPVINSARDEIMRDVSAVKLLFIAGFGPIDRNVAESRQALRRRFRHPLQRGSGRLKGPRVRNTAGRLGVSGLCRSLSLSGEWIFSDDLFAAGLMTLFSHGSRIRTSRSDRSMPIVEAEAIADRQNGTTADLFAFARNPMPPRRVPVFPLDR